MSDFSKKYTPESIQQEIVKTQNRQKQYEEKPLKKNKEKNTLQIVSLPIVLHPNQTTWDRFPDIIRQDAHIRYERMLGKRVRYIPFFSYATTEINKKDSLQMIQRETGMNRQKEKRLKQYIQLGCACDETQEVSLYSPMSIRKIRNTICQLAREDKIQKQYMINFRSNKHQTNITPEDIIRQKTKGKMYHIRYFVDTKNITLVISTPTPETIFGDVALAVHPDDRRYKKLIGHKVIIPIVNKTIPIIGEPTVDTTKNNGVMRVCPCHDIRSLEIAKKHNLNFHNFAIDHNGCFTELAGDFAGKKVVDFFDNIIQNLDDIHNLQEIEDAEILLPRDKQSKERLEPIINEQRFFSYSSPIAPEEVKVIPSQYQALLETIRQNTLQTPWAISKKDAIGIPFPTWKNKQDEYFFMVDTDIFSLPQKISKNKKLVAGMMIFNLIADQRLSNEFTIEDIIDVLFQRQETGDLFGQQYLQDLQCDIPRGYASEIQELNKIFAYADKDETITNMEKCSTQLMNILEKTIGITDNKGGTYTLNMQTLLRSESPVQPSQERIDTTFATALMLLDMTGREYEQQCETTILYANEQEKNTVIKTMLLGESLYQTPIFNQISFFSKEANLPHETAKEMIEKRGNDAMRAYCILEDLSLSRKIKTNEGEKYSGFISKTRNACRFILHHIQEQKKWKNYKEKIDLEELGKTIQKKIGKSRNHEYWMLNNIKELYEDLQEYTAKYEEEGLGNRICGCIKKDFCEKYIEIMKIQSGDISAEIGFFCVGLLLKLIYPITPYVSETLWKLYNFKGTLSSQSYLPDLSYITKNYKTQIFMDIIDRLHQLRERINKPKHEEIDVAVSASIDFQQYLKDNEEIIQKLLHTNCIDYLDNEKDLVKYETDTIIDVTIGVRGIGKPIKEISYVQLEHEISKKQELLQSIRKIASQLSLDSNNNKIMQEKRQEMNDLKKEIEKLEYEVKKIKMNEK